ncbi:polysaccharide deacetylase family protein [Rhizobium lemnae]|uniref:Chitooligosaccharide deacetylase n=1 Tax=Rhizobium lemnae TaxID=1214924 RepID=A0ABV8E7T0_9HYPH|nr:polysaccharide deacetylase family protein [Rhizobium lemnae]MCJ8508260.1 polysaccharide deacetylase family protein [Rhizobium lemnae]
MSVLLQAIWRRSLKRAMIAGGLEAAYVLANLGVLRNARGHGAIFTLHHVRPHAPRIVEPNAHLEVTPEFLDQALGRLKAESYDFIPLSEVPARLANPSERPFACFTLDDGYCNNADHALPVFERHGAPFTIFINEGFADRTHTIWWETVAALINQQDVIQFDFGDGMEEIKLSCPKSKLNLFDRFVRFVQHDCEAQAVKRLDDAARTYGIEPLAITEALTMDQARLRELARNPLAALGAHTVSHRALMRLSAEDAAHEMRRSADWLEEVTGTRPTSLAYPYGTKAAVSDRDQHLAWELGFSVAVTTQPGTLNRASLERLTGLPRISLNGFYQEPRYVAALASGIPFAISRAA